MIELRNINKVYKLKRAEPVQALKNVNIKFGNKGLVFILGKSGSGKSTLLNVMGGLDTATSGEIIIKDKSSKDFSQSDFDSYRNTYLGFIFQEYNILEDFTIGANIGLALKLQGKKATDEAINTILHEVDLDGYGSRKPNELSGGQKQRVAIARALIKNPEIILADEPTGALDSNTGIQVFNTLKKLSQEKLVIVVSHDRDFAEQFGDRVIEFKDGEVISDMEKVIENTQSTTDTNVYGDNLLHFDCGYKLTDKDVKMINSYLERGEAFLTTDAGICRQIKGINHVTESGEKMNFTETDQTRIVANSGAPFKLIRSQMPLKESFKMGASGLKAKPFRLAVTVFMCFICFTLFGLFDSFAAYDPYKAIVNTMITANNGSVGVVKHHVTDYEENEYNEIKMDDSDLQTLKNGTSKEFFGVYSGNSNRLYFYNNLNESNYNDTTLLGFTESNATAFASSGCTFIAGYYPETYDEIAISDYVFRVFKKCGYRDGSVSVKNDDITTAEEFLSTERHIELDGNTYKIAGIFETGVNFSAYENKIENGLVDILFSQAYTADILYGFTGTVFCKEGFYAEKISTSETKKYVCLLCRAKGKSEIRTVSDYVKKSATEDYRYYFHNGASVFQDELGDIISALAVVFKYVAIFILVFSILLFTNYIATSISYKKREIGILRAVGARSLDVFGVFFNESLIIAGITDALSALVGFVVVVLINLKWRNNYGIPITVLSFGFRQIGFLLLVGVATAFVASFLPVMKIARKKPIDAIRNK